MTRATTERTGAHRPRGGTTNGTLALPRAGHRRGRACNGADGLRGWRAIARSGQGQGALRARAKKEGKVIVWGTHPREVGSIPAAFGKLFSGIDVQVLGDNDIAVKAIAEARAGRHQVDVYQNSLTGTLAGGAARFAGGHRLVAVRHRQAQHRLRRQDGLHQQHRLHRRLQQQAGKGCRRPQELGRTFSTNATRERARPARFCCRG